MISSASRRSRSDEGFTLIEVVVSSAILFISIMGVIGAMTFAAQASQSTSIRNKALAIGNQYLEAARNMDYDSVGVRYANGTAGDPPGTILTPDTTTSVGSTFTVYTDVWWARDANPPYRAEYKRMRVTVQWSVPATGQISLETGIFGNSAKLGNGDLEIIVRDHDSFQPVSGAQVTVDPAATGASIRNAWTNSQGSAFFGFVEPGTASVAVNAAGYIYDQSQAATLSVGAAMLNQMVLFVQRPSTIVVNVLDTSSTPVAGALVTAAQSRFGPPRTLTTDGQGRVSFPDSFIGTYTVSVSASGYVTPPTQEATITSGGQSVTLNFSARASGGLRVTVIDDVTDSAVSGASVTVTGPSPGTGQAPGSPGTTSGGGLASFTSLLAGDYNVVIARTGTSGTGPCYVSQTHVSTVAWGADTPLDVRLVPWGSLYIRIMKSGAAKTSYTVKITGPGGYNQTKRSDSAGKILVPYLQAGQYTITKTTGTTPTFYYDVADGVIPATATDLSSTSW